MKITALIVLLTMVSAAYAQPTGQPDSSSEQHCAMMKRGEQGMGFSQEKTAHHFRLFRDGGRIEVSANDPQDNASRDQVRRHLAHIAKLFAKGHFQIPMFVHDTTPPGVPTMTELRDQIHYHYQETGSGGTVRITTTNQRALEAVHAFLRFQISEHQTGDAPK